MKRREVWGGGKEEKRGNNEGKKSVRGRFALSVPEGPANETTVSWQRSRMLEGL